MISLPDWGLAPPAFLRKRKVCVGVYRFAAREHLLGVEFTSAGLDAGGSEQNHSNQKRCKEFGPISSLERRLVSPIRLNGGPQFKFTEAISFVVNCETQEEVDEFWEKLSAGGQKIQCGWLKDKYGVSWQIVPTI